MHGRQVISYPELTERVARLARGLASLGLNRGDRLALLLPNRLELVEALRASFHGGFVAVPLNWHLHPDEAGYIVRDSGAAAIIVSGETADAARVIPGQVHVLHVGTGTR